jgi:hypothetical protein
MDSAVFAARNETFCALYMLNCFKVGRKKVHGAGVIILFRVFSRKTTCFLKREKEL